MTSDTPEEEFAPSRWERVLVHLVLTMGRSPTSSAGDGKPRGILRAFYLAEWLLQRGHDIRPMREGGVLRYEIAPLPRGELPLPAGPPIRAGDPVVVLHFENAAVTAFASTASNRRALAWGLYRETIRDLASFAELVRRNEISVSVRAVWTETLVYSALAVGGFHTRAASPSVRTSFARLYFLALMAIYSHNGVERLSRGRLDHFRLGEAWIGMDELLQRF